MSQSEQTTPKVVVRSKETGEYWREGTLGTARFEDAHRYEANDRHLSALAGHPRLEVLPVIEDGRWYRTREGLRVGPMAPSANRSFPWKAPQCISVYASTWMNDGRFHPHKPSLSHFDLIAIDPLLPLQAGQRYRLRNGSITTELIRVELTPPRFTAYIDNRIPTRRALASWAEDGTFKNSQSEYDIVALATADEVASATPAQRPFPSGLKAGHSYVTRLGLRTWPLMASGCDSFRADIGTPVALIDQSWSQYGKHVHSAFDLVVEAPGDATDMLPKWFTMMVDGAAGETATATKPPFKLQIGKRYRLRDGRVTEPMERSPQALFDGNFPFMARVSGLNIAQAWRADGSWSPQRKQTDSLDCVAEATEPEPVTHTGCLNIYRKGRCIIARLYASEIEADRAHTDGNRIARIKGFSFTEKQGL